MDKTQILQEFVKDAVAKKATYLERQAQLEIAKNNFNEAESDLSQSYSSLLQAGRSGGEYPPYILVDVDDQTFVVRLNGSILEDVVLLGFHRQK